MCLPPLNLEHSYFLQTTILREKFEWIHPWKNNGSVFRSSNSMNMLNIVKFSWSTKKTALNFKVRYFIFFPAINKILQSTYFISIKTSSDRLRWGMGAVWMSRAKSTLPGKILASKVGRMKTTAAIWTLEKIWVGDTYFKWIMYSSHKNMLLLPLLLLYVFKLNNEATFSTFEFFTFSCFIVINHSWFSLFPIPYGFSIHILHYIYLFTLCRRCRRRHCNLSIISKWLG